MKDSVLHISILNLYVEKFVMILATLSGFLIVN